MKTGKNLVDLATELETLGGRVLDLRRGDWQRIAEAA